MTGAARCARVAGAALVGLALVVSLGCARSGSPSPVATSGQGATARSPDSTLATSRDRFSRLDTFQSRIVLQPAGEPGRVEGDAAYRGGAAVYGRVSYVGAALQEGDAAAFLFLPPDLYVQEASGGWIVVSPWNQGTKPSEQEPLGLEKPVIDYVRMVGGLRDATREADDRLDGRGVEHYRGSVRAADLGNLAADDPSGEEVAGVDLWLRPDDLLPARVQVRAPTGDVLTLDYSGYNQQVAAPPPPEGARPLRDVMFPDAPCTGTELPACLEVAADMQGADACAGSGSRICLAPLGRVPADLVQHLVAYYRDRYGLDVTVLKPAAIPQSLEDPQREQVDAAALITFMGSLFPEAYSDPSALLVGITVVDLYDSTSHFRYVFGLRGSRQDPRAVISTFRMNPVFYGEPPDEDLTRARTRKLMSKYIGLLYYGLPTSADPASPMYDSILGPEDLDAMGEPLPVQGAR